MSRPQNTNPYLISLVDTSPENSDSPEHWQGQSHALGNLRSNLDRLQELHSQLHFLLKELEEIVDL